jgi:hypothetical protein
MKAFFQKLLVLQRLIASALYPAKAIEFVMSARAPLADDLLLLLGEIGTPEFGNESVTREQVPPLRIRSASGTRNSFPSATADAAEIVAGTTDDSPKIRPGMFAGIHGFSSSAAAFQQSQP